MKNFIMFFHEKEGSTALTRQLDNFDRVSVVQHESGGGWEPFDLHTSGPLSVHDLQRCFDLIFDRSGVDMEALNAVYGKRGAGPLRQLPRDAILGFKMRFRPHGLYFPRPLPTELLAKLSRPLQASRFRRMMLETMARHDVVALIAVRQDLMRWGLSKYRGKTMGTHGNLQFPLSDGRITRADIPEMHVEPAELETIIKLCEAIHEEKRALVRDLHAAGVSTHTVRYEEYLTDPAGLLKGILDSLEADISLAEIEAVLKQEIKLKKVHSDDIADFVTNHKEIEAMFGDRFVAW